MGVAYIFGKGIIVKTRLKMRNILKTAGLLAVIFLVAGCRDAGHDVSEQPTFKIVDADVNFTASGGEGAIVIEPLGSGAPQIEVEKGWCTATVSGNTVSVTVAPNTDSYSRETSLKITMGDYTRTFGIYQGGIYYYADDDFGQLGYKKDDVLRIPLIREGDMFIDVVDHCSWVNASVDGDEIVVTALSDNDLTPRSGHVTLKAGVQEKTIYFVQTEHPLDYDAYLGEWTFTHMSAASGGELKSVNVVLAVNEEGKSFKMTGLSTYTIVLNYDETNGQLTFKVGDKVGTYTYSGDGVTYDVIIGMLTTAGGVNSTSTTLYIFTTYEIVDSKLVLTFNGSHASYIGGGFAYYYARPGVRAYYYPAIKMYKK